jgi:hypothetical protein
MEVVVLAVSLLDSIAAFDDAGDGLPPLLRLTDGDRAMRASRTLGVLEAAVRAFVRDVPDGAPLGLAGAI